MNYFRTSLVDTRDGNATFGVVERLGRDGETWIYCDRTRAYRVYPRLVRARSAAETRARKWATKLGLSNIAIVSK